MPTTLAFALLNLIAAEPQSGYDLSRTLQEQISFFWQAKHSQIYPELAKLQAEGFITHEAIHQTDKPDKKLYSITPAGIAALREWVITPTMPSPVRDELLVKVAAMWQISQAEALQILAHHEQQHASQLAIYEELRDWIHKYWVDNERRMDIPWFSIYLTVVRGIGFEREYTAWCRWAADLLMGKIDR